MNDNQIIEPISPNDIDAEAGKQIPSVVIAIVNTLLAEKWKGKSATIRQDDIVEQIVAKMSVSREFVFQSNWLDFEGLFRSKGWKVSYEKPCRDESFAAFFRFEK